MIAIVQSENRPEGWRPLAGQFIRIKPYGRLFEPHLGQVETVMNNTANVMIKSPKANTTLGSFVCIPFRYLEPVTVDEAETICIWLTGISNPSEIAVAAFRAQVMEAARQMEAVKHRPV